MGRSGLPLVGVAAVLLAALAIALALRGGERAAPGASARADTELPAAAGNVEELSTLPGGPRAEAALESAERDSQGQRALTGAALEVAGGVSRFA